MQWNVDCPGYPLEGSPTPLVVDFATYPTALLHTTDPCQEHPKNQLIARPYTKPQNINDVIIATWKKICMIKPSLVPNKSSPPSPTKRNPYSSSLAYPITPIPEKPTQNIFKSNNNYRTSSTTPIFRFKAEITDGNGGGGAWRSTLIMS
jgi:hypothetical protein